MDDRPGPPLADIDTVILCGGRGTRAYPDTVDLPKPLLAVGGVPLVEHVMDVYRHHGCRRFLLAAGYRIEAWAERYGVTSAEPPAGPGPGGATVLDTGVDTGTGRRAALAGARCAGERFFLTYGDGLGDVDIPALLRFHVSSGAWVTVTTVPLPSQYGTLATAPDGRVVQFVEKPRLEDHWINAGFFVVDQRALDVWAGDDLEREVLPDLAARGVLYAFRHRGFWRSMDTYKDRQELEALSAGNPPPWLPSPPSAGAGGGTASR